MPGPSVLLARRVDRTAGTIARHVREAIRRDPFLESYEILVTSDDGEVRLTGDVDSYYEKARADDAASKVLGVARVDNDLDVDTYDEPYVYSPFLDDWDVYSYRWYDYEPRSTMKTDSEIRDDIDSELFWSPFVDANEVEVSVDNGWATLEGDVDTWAERSAAVENAYEGGATWVINDLDVERTSAATSGSSGS